MFKELGDHDLAVQACLLSKDHLGAAESCEQLAITLTGEAAQARLQQAIEHCRKAKQPLLGFQLLQKHPQLAQALPAEVLYNTALALLSNCVGAVCMDCLIMWISVAEVVEYVLCPVCLIALLKP